MLLSVQNITEARIVAATDGVSIIDVKDPNQGSLGFAGPDVVNGIVDVVTNAHQESISNVSLATQRRSAAPKLSVALGELLELNSADIASIDWSKIHFAKIGLNGTYADQSWRKPLSDAFAPVPLHVARVLVVYVDQVPPSASAALLSAAHQDGLSVVLLDTFEKSNGNVFAHWSVSDCKKSFQSASALALTTVLAGSIGITDLNSAKQTGADLVGVRGAVCSGDRTETLAKPKLDEFLKAYRELSLDVPNAPRIHH